MRIFYHRDYEEKAFDSFLAAILSTEQSGSQDDSIRESVPGQLNKKQILHFLYFGSHYFSETPHVDITKTFTHQNQILSSEDGFVPETETPPLKRIKSGDAISRFLRFFENRKEILTEYNISIDLTGGIDSRLIATILTYLGIPYDAVYSLGSGDEKESELVRQVARCLNCNIHIIDPPELNSKSDAQRLFEIGDGCWDITRLNSLYHTQKWRAEQGYNLVITGAGGELYKDFWWQQDFPWYYSRKANLSRLLSYRMYPEAIPAEWVHPDYDYTSCEMELISKLETFTHLTNTETYDVIYRDIRIKEQVSALTKASTHFIPVYSPLLEYELLQIGFNLPRSRRFFNRFHRDIITKLNPDVAALPTSEAMMSVSKDPIYLLVDFKKYAGSKSGKLISKIRKVRERKHSISPRKTDPPEFLDNQISQAINTLKEHGIFTEQASSRASGYAPALWGRMWTIAMLISFMNDIRK